METMTMAEANLLGAIAFFIGGVVMIIYRLWYDKRRLAPKLGDKAIIFDSLKWGHIEEITYNHAAPPLYKIAIDFDGTTFVTLEKDKFAVVTINP